MYTEIQCEAETESACIAHTGPGKHTVRRASWSSPLAFWRFWILLLLWLLLSHYTPKQSRKIKCNEYVTYISFLTRESL